MLKEVFYKKGMCRENHGGITMHECTMGVVSHMCVLKFMNFILHKINYAYHLLFRRHWAEICVLITLILTLTSTYDTYEAMWSLII